MSMKIIHDEAERRRTADRRSTTKKNVDVLVDRRGSDRRTGADRRGADRVPLPTCEIEVPAEIEAKSPQEIDAWVQAARAQWRQERLQERKPTTRRRSTKE